MDRKSQQTATGARRIPLLVLGILAATGMPAKAAAANAAPEADLEALSAGRLDQITAARAEAVAQAAGRVDRWAGQLAWNDDRRGAAAAISLVERLIQASQRVERELAAVLKVRTEFAALPAGPERRARLRAFLRITSSLIDLSGRLRYTLHDAIGRAAFAAAQERRYRPVLLDLLIRHRMKIGARIMSVLLVDPPRESGIRPATNNVKQKVLELIAATGGYEQLSHVAGLLRDRSIPAELVLQAAETIRRVGLPQDPRPAADRKQAPSKVTANPPITADVLHRRLDVLDVAGLTKPQHQRRAALLAWLAERRRAGVTGASHGVGKLELRPGDWLLTRNPSPYNLFTDLNPGLFTHVGVVAAERGSDGKRRIVIVEMRERGARIPATNAEAYLQTTLHFFLLRHPNEKVARAMGEAAASMIGNESQFDLTFRTDRVDALRGKPLKGRRIHTYCAGFLLLCAGQTAAPRSEFFPIPEYPAGGETLANLERLGITIGRDFVSPTGAIFSPRLQLVGRRAPFYDPTREIKERVYDHFARRMAAKTLTPTLTAKQQLRQKLAEAARGNPALARMLAQANNVSPHIDLVAAAKAAAVIETLDGIADTAMQQYLAAMRALRAGPLESLKAGGASQKELHKIRRFRETHAKLFRSWIGGELSPRGLRVALVEFYSNQGRQMIDRRFFGGRG